MDKGRIAQIDSPEKVMNHPADPFVAGFCGGGNHPFPALCLMSDEGTFTALVGERRIESRGALPGREKKVFLFIRPEGRDHHPRLPAISHERPVNAFPGTVEKIVAFGPYQKVSMDCGFPVTAYVTKSSVEGLGLREGSEVTASFKASAVPRGEEVREKRGASGG